VDTRAAECGQKEQGARKFLGTQPGIEPGTYRHMKHCPRRHAWCNRTHTVLMSLTLTVTVAENFSSNIDSVCKLIVAVQAHTFSPNVRTRHGIQERQVRYSWPRVCHTVLWESRITFLILGLNARWRWVLIVTFQPLYPWEFHLRAGHEGSDG
jgi:hypothetical protein